MPAFSVHGAGVEADSLCITTLPRQLTMNSTDTNKIAQYLAMARRGAYGPAIEWEELPSLADSLGKRLIHRGAGADFQNSSGFGAAPWDATMPAVLEPMFESDPFSEPMNGVAIRELREPDVFRHFFS
jgi:hypothetical protein